MTAQYARHWWTAWHWVMHWRWWVLSQLCPQLCTGWTWAEDWELAHCETAFPANDQSVYLLSHSSQQDMLTLHSRYNSTPAHTMAHIFVTAMSPSHPKCFLQKDVSALRQGWTEQVWYPEPPWLVDATEMFWVPADKWEENLLTSWIYFCKRSWSGKESVIEFTTTGYTHPRYPSRSVINTCWRSFCQLEQKSTKSVWDLVKNAWIRTWPSLYCKTPWAILMPQCRTPSYTAMSTCYACLGQIHHHWEWQSKWDPHGPCLWHWQLHGLCSPWHNQNGWVALGYQKMKLIGWKYRSEEKNAYQHMTQVAPKIIESMFVVKTASMMPC